jgi:hypothetical protein
VADLFTFEYLQLVVFGVGDIELLSLCGAALKDCSGFGFADDVVQLKCISVFLILVLAYTDPEYTSGQALGLFVFVLGYCCTRWAGSAGQRESPWGTETCCPPQQADRRRGRVQQFGKARVNIVKTLSIDGGSHHISLWIS